MNPFTTVKLWFKSIPHKIYDALYPDLRSNKSWKFVEDNENPCAICGKIRTRGMRCEGTEAIKEGEVNCIPCYLKDKSIESKVVIPKRKLRLWIAGLTFLFILLISIIFYMLIPQRYLYDSETRDAIVAFFYPYTDPLVSKGVLESEINTIINHSKYPDLSLALAYNESRFNPGVISSSGAKGTHQIIGGWTKKLINDGIITEQRDLHDPVKGCIAGDKVLGYHLNKANGDLMLALRDWVGSKKEPEREPFIRKVLITYGNIQLLKMAIKERKFNKENIDGWWIGEKKKLPFVLKKKEQ